MSKNDKIAEKINVNIQLFVNNWKALKRSLESFGYVPSNIQTFMYAKKQFGQFPNPLMIPNSKDIDIFGLGGILQSMQTNDLAYVSFAYPLLDDFNIFYYKKQDAEITEIVKDSFVRENQAKIETLDKVIERLTTAKMSVVSDEDKYDRIVDEIELMEQIQDFSTSSELIIKEIQFHLNNQINDINEEMKFAKLKMVADDYFKFETKKIDEVREITERVVRNVRFLINVSDN